MNDLDALFAAARAVRARAYAPYSRFAVGAALIDENGVLYAGCNVENAAYPVGTCAEAGAIAAMIAGGGRRIVALAVAGQGLVTPCGACRQRIREFGSDETRVHCIDEHAVIKIYALKQLLPDSFGPDNLAKEHLAR
ncbi:MAG: cytidine deaminase [Hyphomicrobiales bacterium]|nr:cytidine deaminase [Hyphomicrobiales bacterium]